MRYLSKQPNTNSKVWSKQEVEEYRAAGLWTGYNWEWNINDADGGFARGQSYALMALEQMTNLGVPTHNTDGSPICIYYSNDRRDDENHSFSVPYYEGIADIHRGTGYEVGAYASQWVLDILHDQELITFGWKVETWGPDRDWFHLIQLVNGEKAKHGIPGIDADVNNVLKANWGGWAPEGVLIPSKPAVYPNLRMQVRDG